MDEQKVATERQTQQSSDDGKPKFGRLLLVLIFAVFLIGVITWATELYWS